jgi:putative NADPH-quinone reductase
VILNKIESADVIVLGPPVNFGTVTAVMKKFMERSICYVYWPWGTGTPQVRRQLRTKQAVVVTSSAAPEIVARFSSNIIKLLKQAAGRLGAKKTEVLYIGLAAMEPKPAISYRIRKKAGRLGVKLARE